MQAAKRTPVDLREWAIGLMEKHNRKSHLAPQLSPATQELLRNSDSPTAPASSTPTSGEIPIGGADVRSGVTSPRDQVVNSMNSAKSPANTKNTNGSIGRSAGAGFHPGMRREVTTNSIPKVTTLSTQDSIGPSGAASASAATFSHTLPIRPAPPAGPLPPPPPVPRKESDLDAKKESRRQAAFGSNSNGVYGGGY